MEARCDAHGLKMAAYCMTDRVILCFQCCSENNHRLDECNVLSENDQAVQKDLFFACVNSLQKTVHEKRTWIETEQMALDLMKHNVTTEIKKCYLEHSKRLQSMEQTMLDALDASIKERKAALARNFDELGRIQCDVTSKTKDMQNKAGIPIDSNDVKAITQTLRMTANTLDENISSAVKMHVSFTPRSIENAQDVGTLKLFENDSDAACQNVLEDHVKADAKKQPLASGSGRSQSVKGSESYSSQPVSPFHTRTQSIKATKHHVDDDASLPLLVDTREIEVICTSAVDGNPCCIKKIEWLADKRFVVLDSAHNAILLVENDGTVSEKCTFPDPDATHNGQLLDMCLAKGGTLATLYAGKMGLYMSNVDISGKIFKVNKTFRVADQIVPAGIPCTGFEFEARSRKYVVSFQGITLLIKDGKLTNQRMRMMTKTTDSSSMVTLYDVQEDSMYTLNKDEKILSRYDSKANQIVWEQSVLFEHFTPLAMRNHGQNALTVLSNGRLFVIDKKTGCLIKAKKLDFDKDIQSFGEKGHNIVVAKPTLYQEDGRHSLTLVVFYDVLA